MVKSCSGHLKHVNPSKTGSRKFSGIQYYPILNPIQFLMYIEESEIKEEIKKKYLPLSAGSRSECQLATKKTDLEQDIFNQ